MPPPRGLKALVKRTATARLTKGKIKCFVAVNDTSTRPKKLQGITKKIEKRLYSRDSMLPIIARQSDERPGGHWRGPNGGRLRGKKVDAQLTRIANTGGSKAGAHVYRLTKLVLEALRQQGLELLCAQRSVCVRRLGLATAADLVCFSPATSSVVILELKCGFPSGRKAAALSSNGQPQAMQAPLERAADCVLHRHFAQLACTYEMSKSPALQNGLQKMGLCSEIDAVLMYACDKGVETFRLPDWWKKRAPRMLERIGGGPRPSFRNPQTTSKQ